MTVVGDPGYGKTIQIRQFTNNLISNELEKKEGVFPFFMKAKIWHHLLTNISIPELRKQILIFHQHISPGFEGKGPIESFRKRPARIAQTKS